MVKAEVYLRKCLSKTPCVLPYSGAEDNIYFWSKQTAAGDEIGWDFCSRVVTTKSSFTAFCTDMTRIYKSVHPLSPPFMSRSTFIQWFFSWAAAMDIDFRQDVDPWCGHNPTVLACDATHVGVAIRNLHISPINKPDTDAVVFPSHRRFDRVFLPYNTYSRKEDVVASRSHLSYLCTLVKGESKTTLSPDDMAIGNNLLLQCCPQNPSCKQVLQNFVSQIYPDNISQRLSDILLFLATDHPISTLLPTRFIPEVYYACTSLINSSPVDLTKTKEFCPELFFLLKEVQLCPCRDEICNFILYLTHFVDELHGRDVTTVPANPMANSYDPESGVALYFTPHGNKLRKFPKYSVSGTNQQYDDNPDAKTKCSKQYPQVSRGGWSNVMLFFCPIHGHCYGFSIIDGSEGRKDVFAPLFAYAESAPDDLFYDFACSLNEYCLNREPAFFKNTRFWEDIFHGVSHKCYLNYKSVRIANLRHVNSEICEQFNAFIQCIKYTATHLSQSHFCFFLQFMISIWQKNKTKSFSKKYEIADAVVSPN